MNIREALRHERAQTPESTPLRKSLQARHSVTQLIKSARRSHDLTTWGYADHDDPGEEAQAVQDAWDIVDQEAVADRPHRPGFHGRGHASAVAKSGEEQLSDQRPAANKPLPKGAHRTPPKGYPTDRSQYADPATYTYPIDTPEHVRAAISYFSKPKNAARYTPATRKRMWARIRRAAQRFGIQVQRRDGT